MVAHPMPSDAAVPARVTKSTVVGIAADEAPLPGEQ